jgi:hypothetical protein
LLERPGRPPLLLAGALGERCGFPFMTAIVRIGHSVRFVQIALGLPLRSRGRYRSTAPRARRANGALETAEASEKESPAEAGRWRRCISTRLTISLNSHRLSRTKKFSPRSLGVQVFPLVVRYGLGDL